MKVSPKSTLGKVLRHRQVYAMLLPNVILFSALSLYPILWVLRFMFYRYDKITEPVFIGLENFVRAFTRDTYFWRSVINTFVYVGGKLLITLPLAFLIALVLNIRFRGRNLLQIVIFSPTIMSAAVMSMIFYLLFNPYSGQVNTILMQLKLIDEPINWLGDHAMLTVILVGVWGAVGNYMVYFMAGLQSISTEIYESAELDGITPIKKLFHITIPMMAPILKIIVMISITSSLQDMQSTMVLTEGGPNGATEVMFLYIYKLFFPISANNNITVAQYGYGAALSFICAIIIGIITLVYLKLTKKLDDIF